MENFFYKIMLEKKSESLSIRCSKDMKEIIIKMALENNMSYTDYVCKLVYEDYLRSLDKK